MKPIEAIHDGRQILYFASVIAAEREGYCRQAVYGCLKGTRKHHRGYQWRYATPAAKLGMFVAAHCCQDDRRTKVVLTTLHSRFIGSLPIEERPDVSLQDVCDFAFANYGIDRRVLHDVVRGLFWSDWANQRL